MAFRPRHARSACRHLACGEGAVYCSLATESIEPKPAPFVLLFVFSVYFVVKVFWSLPLATIGRGPRDGDPHDTLFRGIYE